MTEVNDTQFQKFTEMAKIYDAEFESPRSSVSHIFYRRYMTSDFKNTKVCLLLKFTLEVNDLQSKSIFI